jgi:hypothetical protein
MTEGPAPHTHDGLFGSSSSCTCCCPDPTPEMLREPVGWWPFARQDTPQQEVGS